MQLTRYHLIFFRVLTIKDISLNLLTWILKLVEGIIGILSNNTVLNRADYSHKHIVLQKYISFGISGLSL
jgi:hypothetical protein